MQDFARLTALEAVESIKSKKFSALDYVSGLTEIIEARDPEIEAWAAFDGQYSIQQAARVDAFSVPANYPLLGVPVGIKDIIDTADMPTENGTVLDAGRQPIADAAVVRLLRQAGAVIIGKTITTELAYFHPSKTRNPHNVAHTPGGSSSGSAAAVACGMVPIALGTQTNGSVIRPASFCGIFALKPTNGLFSRAGVLEESATFDSVGIFARTLEDVAAVAEVLATYDSDDKSTMPRGRVKYLKYARSGPEITPRLAFVKTQSWDPAEEATKEEFLKLSEILRPNCEVLDLPPEFEQGIPHHRTVMLAEIALNFGHYYDRAKDGLSAAMRKAIEDGRAISAVDYCKGLQARQTLYGRLEQLLKPYDAIITPPALGAAPRGQEATGNPAFCSLWTYLATPAMNLPFLQVGGMPLGIQLVGRRFEEARLFQTATWLAKALTEKGYKSSIRTSW